jgi:hypothetical protein
MNHKFIFLLVILLISGCIAQPHENVFPAKEVRETPQYSIQLVSRLFLKLPSYSEE